MTIMYSDDDDDDDDYNDDDELLYHWVKEPRISFKWMDPK